jgi:SOS response associated peptidase (SRAP)
VPLLKRRCLVPLSGFYEWRKSDKMAFPFTLSDQPMYALAGFLDAWKNLIQARGFKASQRSPSRPARPCRGSTTACPPSSRRETMTNGWTAGKSSARPSICSPYDAPPAGSYLQVTPANPKVGNVRDQDISMLDSQ